MQTITPLSIIDLPLLDDASRDDAVPVPTGQIGVTRDWVRMLADEKRRCASASLATSTAEIAALMPLHHLIDIASRVFRVFAVASVNPGVPESMRDRSLAQFIDVMRMVQHDIFMPRLKVLSAFWADPAFHLVTLLHDVEAVCRTPEYMAQIEPTVRRAYAAQRATQDPGSLVSNLMTLLVALTPFDAAWQCIARHAHTASYAGLLQEGSDMVSPLRLGIHASAVFSRFVYFALPPNTPRCDPDGIVVGSPTKNLSNRLHRKQRQFDEAALLASDVIDTDASDAMGLAVPVRRSPKPVAIVSPPVAPEAPHVARIGCATLVAGIVSGSIEVAYSPAAVERPAGDTAVDPDYVAFKASTRSMPSGGGSRRASAVREFLHSLAAAGADVAVATPSHSTGERSMHATRRASPDREVAAPAAKQHRPEPTAAVMAVTAQRNRRSIGVGLPRVPFDIQRMVLSYLPPRALRAATCTCKRWASFVRQSPSLNAATWLSFHFSKRFEWYLEDEWGERVMALPSLPPFRGPQQTVEYVPRHQLDLRY